jgi:hypothetical protein
VSTISREIESHRSVHDYLCCCCTVLCANATVPQWCSGSGADHTRNDTNVLVADKLSCKLVFSAECYSLQLPLSSYLVDLTRYVTTEHGSTCALRRQVHGSHYTTLLQNHSMYAATHSDWSIKDPWSFRTTAIPRCVVDRPTS